MPPLLQPLNLNSTGRVRHFVPTAAAVIAYVAAAPEPEDVSVVASIRRKSAAVIAYVVTLTLGY